MRVAASAARAAEVAARSPSPPPQEVEKIQNGWDPDIVAYMGREALDGSQEQFEEQLKYVPGWVADKAKAEMHVRQRRPGRSSGH